MNKKDMLLIAERNMKKAQRALERNKDRAGITEEELKNLLNNVQYTSEVYRLIDRFYDGQ